MLYRVFSFCCPTAWVSCVYTYVPSSVGPSSVGLSPSPAQPTRWVITEHQVELPVFLAGSHELFYTGRILILFLACFSLFWFSSLPKESKLIFLKKNKKTLPLPALWLRHCWSAAPAPRLCALWGLCSPATPDPHCLSILSCFSQHTPSYRSQNGDTQWLRNLCLTFSYQKALFTISVPPPHLHRWLFLLLLYFLKYLAVSDSVLLITLHKALPVLLWMQGPSFTEALSWIALVFIAHRCNENFDWKFTRELTCGLQLLKDFLCFHGLLGVWMRPGLVLVHPHHKGVPPQASRQVVFPIPLRGDPGLWHPCPLRCVRLSQSPSLLRPASGLLPHSDGPNFLHAPRLLLVTPMLSEIWCF